MSEMGVCERCGTVRVLLKEHYEPGPGVSLICLDCLAEVEDG